MDDRIKVSVIVPVYNAGDRIYKCLDTLVNQTLREIEIICVLDCPTDGTDKEVEEYAKKDDRIVIVRNECNVHISGSRNEGLKIARGEYIGFSDHDDYRDLKMYEILYDIASKENDDIVVSDVRVNHENGREENVCWGDVRKEAIINSIILPMEAPNNSNRISKSVWHSIYRKSLLDKNDIRFEDRRVYFEEDTLFNLKAMIYANNVGYSDEVLYVWDKHYDSESNKWPTEIPKKQIKAAKYMATLLFQTCKFDCFKNSLYQLLSKELNVYFTRYKALEGKERTELCGMIREIRFPVFGRYDLRLLSKKRIKLLFFVLKAKYIG